MTRYTMAELKALIDAGKYYPIPDDAPTMPVDEDFRKNARPVSVAETTSVELQLKRSTLERFKASGSDYLERMAHILEEQAKKAS